MSHLCAVAGSATQAGEIEITRRRPSGFAQLTGVAKSSAKGAAPADVRRAPRRKACSLPADRAQRDLLIERDRVHGYLEGETIPLRSQCRRFGNRLRKRPMPLPSWGTRPGRR